MTLLHYIAKAGAHGIGDVDESCRMATLLLQRGADVFVRCRWTNMTPLHYAVFFDVAPVVRILLEHSNALGTTSTHIPFPFYKAKFFLYTCVYVTSGVVFVDVESKCTEFEHGTPLHVAAANLAFDSATVLLQFQANPQERDSLGRTPAGKPHLSIEWSLWPTKVLHTSSVYLPQLDVQLQMIRVVKNYKHKACNHLKNVAGCEDFKTTIPDR